MGGGGGFNVNENKRGFGLVINYVQSSSLWSIDM